LRGGTGIGKIYVAKDKQSATLDIFYLPSERIDLTNVIIPGPPGHTYFGAGSAY
jgi:hypothetical protein